MQINRLSMATQLLLVPLSFAGGGLCLLWSEAPGDAYAWAGRALTALACIILVLPDLFELLGTERSRIFRIRAAGEIMARLARTISVPLLTAALVIAGSSLWYMKAGSQIDVVTKLSSDWLIAWQQVQRAKQLPTADVLIIGDSSCLMGIDAKRLSILMDQDIQSLCSLGWIGPAGYADMLSLYLNRHHEPVDVVVLMAPVSINRNAAWREFKDISRFSKVSAGSSDPWKGALDTLRSLFEPVFPEPLPSVFGQYFGGRNGFVGEIRRNHGSSVDPNAGLDSSTLSEFLSRHPPSTEVSADAPEIIISPAFKRAGRRFDARLEKYPQARLWFGVMPAVGAVPEATGRATWMKRARLAAKALGIEGSHVLRMPATRPISQFSIPTHLNRWGRHLHTTEFSRTLSEKLIVGDSLPE